MSLPPTSLFGWTVPTGLVTPLLLAIPAGVIFLSWQFDSPKSSKKDQKAHPDRTQPTAFCGPFGTAIMLIFLPFLVYWLYYTANGENLVSFNPFSGDFLKYASNPLKDGVSAWFASVWSWKVFGLYCSWVFYHWVLYLIVPGTIFKGRALRAPHSAVQLEYRLNAVSCHIISVATVFALVYFGVIPATYGYDNFVQLITAAWIFSAIFAIILFLWSHISIPDEDAQAQSPLHLLAQPGNTGVSVYDHFLGRMLNPRIGFLDLKSVCELRPGLIGWTLLNYSMAAAQYSRTGSVSLSMILVCAFQGYYVLDSHLSEQAFFSTMDVISEGFGYMLAFGDLAWVPFTYCTQARYLVDYDPNISIAFAVFIVIMKLIGLYMFRSSNNEKNRFRLNPDDPAVAHLEFIKTKSGRNLLCSGWWGKSRHINYMADIIMAIAWSLPAGFASPIPYFYPVYFTTLLVGRQMRDDESCHEKYGEAWEEYCKRVPWRICPYIY